jgi:O-methyltransferase involved in polyketide biosynthesis
MLDSAPDEAGQAQRDRHARRGPASSARGTTTGLRPLVRHADEPYVEWFAHEHSEGARRYLAAWTSGQRSPIMTFFREQMGAGVPRFYTLLRKLFVEDEARRALAGGVRQLVVLGAGYDPLAIRLCLEMPDLRAFEVDHPPTQDVKRRALAAHDACPPGLALVPVDFFGRLGRGAPARRWLRPPGACVLRVRGHAHVPDAEGRRLRVRSGPRPFAQGLALRVHLGGRGAAGDRRQGRPPSARCWKATGEPLQSSCDPATIDAFLAERGFRMVGAGDAAALRARYLEPHDITRPLSPLEFAVLAEAG